MEKQTRGWAEFHKKERIPRNLVKSCLLRNEFFIISPSQQERKREVVGKVSKFIEMKAVSFPAARVEKGRKMEQWWLLLFVKGPHKKTCWGWSKPKMRKIMKLPRSYSSHLSSTSGRRKKLIETNDESITTNSRRIQSHSSRREVNTEYIQRSLKNICESLPRRRQPPRSVLENIRENFRMLKNF